MDIHEYQAKELLAGFGLPIPRGGVAYSAEQAVYRAAEIGGDRWVVKAQVHAGARGKAGGIKLCASDVEVRQAAKDLLGRTLVTPQTGPEGLPVHRVLIEQALPVSCSTANVSASWSWRIRAAGWRSRKSHSGSPTPSCGRWWSPPSACSRSRRASSRSASGSPPRRSVR